jgi:hypothetical protein
MSNKFLCYRILKMAKAALILVIGICSLVALGDASWCVLMGNFHCFGTPSAVNRGEICVRDREREREKKKRERERERERQREIYRIYIEREVMGNFHCFGTPSAVNRGKRQRQRKRERERERETERQRERERKTERYI